MNEGDLAEGMLEKLRQRATYLGLHSTNIPTEVGGQGCTALQQVLVQEQGGRVTNTLAWVLATPPPWWVDVATPDQLERWLRPDGPRRERGVLRDHRGARRLRRLRARGDRAP